jgi:hypothetical protein
MHQPSLAALDITVNNLFLLSGLIQLYERSLVRESNDSLLNDTLNTALPVLITV